MNIEEKENSMLIEEHEYDGIKELDNDPPPWLMWVFYATVIWGFGYLGYYTMWDGNYQGAEYKNEIAEAKTKYIAPAGGTLDENNIVLLSKESELEAGRQIFNSKSCNTCHGQVGEGNQIGPNLTDKSWIHSNSATALFKTVKYGFPEVGMLPFKDKLSDTQIHQVVSFILVKLKGTNPPNAREPQGKVYE